MKALLKHKIKSVFPALIYGGVVMVASVVLTFIQINQYSIYELDFGTFYMERLSNNFLLIPVALVPIAVAMGMILTQEYGKRDQEDFLGGLPYKRNVRFLISILPGVIYFLAYGLIVSVAVIISHSLSRGEFEEIYLMSSNYETLMQMDGVGNALLRIAQITLTLLSLFFTTVFASVTGRNAVVTILIMVGIPVFPLIFCNAVGQVADIPMLTDIERYTGLSGLFDEPYFISDGYEWYVSYESSLERTIVAGISIIIWCLLSYYFATKSDRLYGKLVVSKILEKIFVFMSGIYAACFSIYIIENFDFNTEIKLIIMILVFVAIEIALYKVITGKGKYDYLNEKGKKQ